MGKFTDDFYRYEGERAFSFFLRVKGCLFTPPVRYIFLFRKTQNAKTFVTRFLWSSLLRLCSYEFGIQIPPETKIGNGFRILHFGTIVINPETIIGKNFNIAEGCLVGCSEGRKKGTPIIGNNVVMGANSIIVGGVKIGDDVLIAPGAFVNFDVPSNSIVIGNPGRIIPQEQSPTKKYELYQV